MSWGAHGKHGSGGGGGHDGAGGMRWLLTYADLITLLLVFFIIAFAAASQDKDKLDELALALAAAFSPFKSDAPFPVEGYGLGEGIRSSGRMSKEQQEKTLLSQLQDATSLLENKQADIRFYEDQPGIRIAIPVLFADDLVTIRDDAKPFLARLAGLLQMIQFQTEVVSYRTSPPPLGHTAWSLTTEQAATIVRYLVESGHVSARQLTAAGRGPNMPLPDDGAPDNEPPDGLVIRILQNAREKK